VGIALLGNWIPLSFGTVAILLWMGAAFISPKSTAQRSSENRSVWAQRANMVAVLAGIFLVTSLLLDTLPKL